MTPVDTIRALAATTRRSDKQQILIDAWMKGEREFFRGAQLAYDIAMPFHVKKVASIVEDDGTAGKFGWKQFEKLARALHRQELSDPADAINNAALAAPVALWNEFYRRILLKDLRVVDQKLINKTLRKMESADPTAGDYLIPTFACQQARPASKKHMRGRKMVDVHLTGMRLLTFLDKPGRTVVQRTPNGVPNHDFPHLTTALVPLIDRLPASIVLDGVIVKQSLPQLMTHETTHDDVSRLAVFDLVVTSQFLRGKWRVPQGHRHTVLSGLAGHLQEFTMGNVYIVPKILVDLDNEHDQERLHMFARGTNCVMVKDPDAPYESTRNYHWQKMMHSVK